MKVEPCEPVEVVLTGPSVGGPYRQAAERPRVRVLEVQPDPFPEVPVLPVPGKGRGSLGFRAAADRWAGDIADRLERGLPPFRSPGAP
jgi:hypothetical protein